MDRGRPNRRSWCETSRRRERHRARWHADTRGGVACKASASRSRRTSRTPRPCRPTTRPPLDAGLDALGLDARAGAARAPSTATSGCSSRGPQAINLTAVREPAAAATVHVVDSLTAVAPLRGRGIDRFLDLGSGGGLPGIPLAAALPARERCSSSRSARRPRFLATAVEATGLAGRVGVAATRAETLAADPHQRGRLAGGDGPGRRRAGGPRRARVPAPRRWWLPRRLEAGDLTTSWRPPDVRSMPSVAAASRSSTRRLPGLGPTTGSSS